MTKRTDLKTKRAVRLRQSVADLAHPASLWKSLTHHPVELSLFLCLWFVYGVTANSRNQFEFNLQQAGVEAIVERKHFYLEGSPTPRLQVRVYYDGDKPFGDVFEYRGHQYAAKQPGQFMLGALVYFFLHLIGLSYVHHYALTSVLVGFFTTSLVTALGAIAVFRIVLELRGSRDAFWPIACALIYGLGTTAFPYAGFAHHDGIASGFLVMGFYLAVVLARRQLTGSAAKFVGGCCGLLLGLTLTTSMLPFFMACVVCLYVLSRRRWDVMPAFVLGGLIGIAPLMFYNSVSFGNPFLNSYTAGGYPQSDLHFDLPNSIAKFRFYVSEISHYIPVAWLGIVALAFYPQEQRREPLALLTLLLAHVFQILNIESHGGCHYGPRFLLPALPFICIGLAGFSYLRSPRARLTAIAATVGLGAASIFVNAAGATYTAMYCETNQYALRPALANLSALRWSDFPLAPWLFLPLAMSVVLLARSMRDYRLWPRNADRT